MHIEPGFIAPAKVALANIALIGLLGSDARRLLNLTTSVRTALAALFFSLFMQSFHLPVGPSELHFVGAMAIYLLFGFQPTLWGFFFGLLLQGTLFEPQDLPHLAVNTLSLIVPLIAVHTTLGRRLDQTQPLNWGTILRLDALYYGTMTLMVGFWLSIGETATPLAAWLTFASSYLTVVLCEPLLTMAAVRLLGRYRNHPMTATCFALRSVA